MHHSDQSRFFTRGHALIIGGGHFQNHQDMQAPVPANDANALARALGDVSGCGYPAEQIALLTNKQATHVAILTAFDRLVERAGPDATIVISYSGHAGYGADHAYRLATYDSEFIVGGLLGNNSISERELLLRIGRLRAQHLLLLLNTCAHTSSWAGCASPSANLVVALLAGHRGRVVITASREKQRSLVGPDQLTLFGSALAESLHGNGVSNKRGYISVFDLYRTVYQRVCDAALAHYGQLQEPELTVIETARPFAVGLYPGESPFSGGSAQRSLHETAARAVAMSDSRAMFDRLLQRSATSAVYLDARNSQGLIYRPEGPVEIDQVYGTQIKIENAIINMPQRLPALERFPAPKLPDHFVRRPEISDRLKRQLLAQHASANDTLVVSAIRGLGGIGKSTLVAALARDSDIQRHFRDGLLWATLGQQPDVLTRLTAWVRMASGYDVRPGSVEAASEYLRALLYDKSVLLVIDDAWDPSHVSPFLVGGPKCQAVITTRDALIAKVVRAPLFDVDVMTVDEALKLLAGRLGHPIALSDQKHALAVADEVGYLPLALELAAAQVASGMPWEVLRTELQSEIANLESLELAGAQEVSSETLRKDLSLSASFQLSLRRLPEEYRQAFIWLGVLPEDILLMAAMGVTLWNTNLAGVYRILQYLYDKTLLLAGISRPDGIMLAYRLHDLLHDMARQLLTATPTPSQPDKLPGLGIELPVAHARLLDRYRARTRGGLLHNLDDDGYIHTNLTWHMQQAGQPDDLHALLREETDDRRNGWYVACDRLSQTASYLSDIERARQLAQPAALQCRYALMVASLNSLAQNISPSLLALLVQKHVWTPVQGLAYARQAPSSGQRAAALAELAPHLPRELRAQALAMVEAIADERQRQTGLIMLATRMPEAQDPALAAAHMIADEADRVAALTLLAPYVRGEERRHVIEQALTAAPAISDRIRRVDALLALAPLLEADERRATLSQTLTDARGIADDVRRSRALEALVRCTLMSGDMQQALIYLRDPDNMGEQQRAALLAECAPRLSPVLQVQAIEIVQQFADKTRRIITLAALAPHLRPDLWARAQRTALAEARQIDNTLSRIKALAALAPHLPGDLHDIELQHALALVESALVNGNEATENTASIIEPDQRVQALAVFLPHLPQPQQQRVFDALLGTIRTLPRLLYDARDAGATEQPLGVGIAPRLHQLEALTVVVPYIIDPGQLEQVLTMVSGLPLNPADPLAAALLYALSARFLTLGQRQRALTVALMIPQEEQQAAALEALAPHLTDGAEAAKVIAAARQMKDGRRQTQVLSTLAPMLSEDLLRQALAVLQRIGDVDAQQATHKVLTPDKAEKQRLRLEQLLMFDIDSGTMAVEDKLWTVSDEVSVRHPAEHGAAQEVMGSVAAVVQDDDILEDSELTVEQLALESLPPLRGKALKQAIEAILDVGSEAEIAETLAAQAQQLSEPMIRQALAAQERVGLSGWIVARLVPRLAELGFGQQALQAAQNIPDQFWRTQALSAVARHLPVPLLPQALVLGAPLETLADRLQALNYPTQKDAKGYWRLPRQLILPAFQAAQQIDEETWRARILTLLAPELARFPRADLGSLWREFLRSSGARSRRDVLADIRTLISVIIRLDGVEGLDEAAQAVLDVGRWWP